MKKKTTTSEQKPAAKNDKQMKLFLSPQEHTVVSLAANMKGMNIKDYMKEAVMEKAKKDAKGFSTYIDSL